MAFGSVTFTMTSAGSPEIKLDPYKVLGTPLLRGKLALSSPYSWHASVTGGLLR